MAHNVNMATPDRGKLRAFQLTAAVITGLLLLVLTPGVRGQCASQGTTPQIQEIVLGRCLHYQFDNPHLFCENGTSTKKNCTELADLFILSFSYKPNCNVTHDSFDDFIKKANVDVPSGKSMFWSGTNKFAHSYSNGGRRITTQEDSFIGYLSNGLEFCGQETAPGLVYDHKCDRFYPTDNCTNPAMYSFWAMASKNFAARASGEVTAMLNGSRSEPFRLNSFFALWEVPYLDVSRITRVKIYMVHVPGHKISSTCDSENIGELKRRLSQRNITYVCEDSPRGPQTILCADHLDQKDCRTDTDDTSGAQDTCSCVERNVLVSFLVLEYLRVCLN